jgi:hypothetical protein
MLSFVHNSRGTVILLESHIKRVKRAAPQILYAQDNCRSNTPMDLVQELEAETNTASEDHQRLDEIYTALHRASIEYYMRRKRE